MDYYKQYEHDCELKFDDIDEISKLRETKFQRMITKLITIDIHSLLTAEFLNSRSSMINELRTHLIEYPTTIHPLSPFKFFWEIIMAVVFTLGLVLVPLDYMHYVEKHHKRIIDYVTLNLCINSVCLIDMFMRFHNGYIKNYEAGITKISKTVLLIIKKTFSDCPR